MKLILVGAFIETIELAKRLNFQIAGYSDNCLKTFNEHDKKFRYFGTDNDFLASSGKFREENLLFITPDNPNIRERLFIDYQIAGFRFANLISDKANISESATFITHSSTMIQDLVNISSCVEIGRGVKINTAANIMHDCKVHDFVTIAPNAVLLGGVAVENGAYIGANSTILPGIRIGRNAIVGAGAVVTKDVQHNDTVIGVPATILKK